MYSLPSTSHIFEPSARVTKNGSPPTFRKARTGEFTPPGMRFCARAKSLEDCEFKKETSNPPTLKAPAWQALNVQRSLKEVVEALAAASACLLSSALDT